MQRIEAKSVSVVWTPAATASRNTLALVSALLVLFLTLQSSVLTPAAGRHAGIGWTSSAPGDCLGSNDTKAPAGGPRRATCDSALFCCLTSFESALFTDRPERSFESVRRTFSSQRFAYFALTSSKPNGWETSWSSRAPPGDA